jgi:LysM repeat protein
MRVWTNKGLVTVNGRLYVVQFGDSLYLISQRFGVSVAELLSFNDQLNNSTLIFPGEILYIPILPLMGAKKKKTLKKR